MLAERNEMMQRIEAVGGRTQCRLDRLDEMCDQNGWYSPPDWWATSRCTKRRRPGWPTSSKLGPLLGGAT